MCFFHSSLFFSLALFFSSWNTLFICETDNAPVQAENKVDKSRKRAAPQLALAAAAGCCYLCLLLLKYIP